VTGVRLVGRLLKTTGEKFPYQEAGVSYHRRAGDPAGHGPAREMDIATLMQGVFYEDLKKI